tara:strand:+ start:104 stop:376 length:273 start_codon:yes stop_codon:yes gene_type:complete
MGNTNSKSKIFILSSSQEFTGKIEKLQALGAQNESSGLHKFVYGDINATSQITGSDLASGKIEVPNGAVLEGPAVTASCSDGHFVVYFRT